MNALYNINLELTQKWKNVTVSKWLAYFGRKNTENQVTKKSLGYRLKITGHIKVKLLGTLNINIDEMFNIPLGPIKDSKVYVV